MYEDTEKSIRQYKLSKIIDVEHQEIFDILDNLYDKLKATHSTKNTHDFNFNLYFFNNEILMFAIRPNDKFMWFCSDNTIFNISYRDRLSKFVFAIIKDLYNIEVAQIHRNFSSSEIKDFGELYQKY